MENSKSTNISDELLQLVSFKMGEEEFGVDILKVQEINRMLDVTQLPNAPHYVDGVVNLRGKVIPIIDLRTRLGLDRKPHDKNTRIVVMDLEKKTIGFVVDAVREVLRIHRHLTETPPETISAHIDDAFITSIAKLDDRLLLLLNLESALTGKEELPN